MRTYPEAMVRFQLCSTGGGLGSARSVAELLQSVDFKLEFYVKVTQLELKNLKQIEFPYKVICML